jgi:hypothetical protein
MNVTSAEFRKNNKILFEANFVNPDNKNIKNMSQAPTDIIDLNGNNKADYQDKYSIWDGDRREFAEPALDKSLSLIVYEGTLNGKEVVNERDYPGLSVSDIKRTRVAVDHQVILEDFKHVNTRSMNREVKDILREKHIQAHNPKWAIDINQGVPKFLIYDDCHMK